MISYLTSSHNIAVRNVLSLSWAAYILDFKSPSENKIGRVIDCRFQVFYLNAISIRLFECKLYAP